MPDEDLSPEDFMAVTGLKMDTPKLEKASGRRVKKSLLEGDIGAVELKPEIVSKDTTKLARVLTIIRKPTGRIANIELRVKDGTLYSLEIDEATATAIYQAFQVR